ncbi:kinase-like domain-containing protein [Entophlyctis helioformis]|nr:kinase-like domain-containing protein [Entophlyctis helioformis]
MQTHFTIIRRVGRGSTGTVLLARQHADRLKQHGQKQHGQHQSEHADGGLVCIKHVPLARLDPKDKAQVKLEADILREASACPSIVRLVEAFEEHQALCLVLEHAARGDLAAAIEARQGHHFDERQILHWFTQLSEALAFLHARRILHRDIKTRNILLDTNQQLRLADFGAARRLGFEHAAECSATTLIGTPYNMSPEILSGQPYSYPSDVWSSGCVLYQLFCLLHPFTSASVAELIPKVLCGLPDIPECIPRRWTALLKKIMHVDPNCRPAAQSIVAFLASRLVGRCTESRLQPSSAALASNSRGELRHSLEVERDALAHCVGPQALRTAYAKCRTSPELLRAALAAQPGCPLQRTARLVVCEQQVFDIA